MIIIVCGPRDWQDWRLVAKALNEASARKRHPAETITVIQGGARGADNQAKSIAQINGWQGITYAPDDADGYPQKFFIRNQRMADHKPKPDLCIAMIAPCFKNDYAGLPGCHMTHGTADMIRRAKANDIPVVPFGEVELYV